MKKQFTILVSIILWSFNASLFAQNCVQCSGGSANGNTATIIGINNMADGTSSFAGGLDSRAIGKQSFAFGDSAFAMSPYCIALGKEVMAFGGASVALGQYVNTTISSSMVFGYGFNVNNKLQNSTLNSIIFGCNSDKSTLFIGPSSGLGLTGKVGIGDVTDPQAKLHVKADNLEAAELFLEPYQFGVSAGATLWLGTKQYGVRATYGKLEFKTGDDGRYVFNEGNVGIGNANPTQKLEVSGNLKTAGIIMEKGAGAGKVLTSDASGQATWQVISGDGHWMENGNDLYRLNGSVGIGTQLPQAKLHVIGDLKLLSDNPTFQFQILGGGQIPARRGISITDDPHGAFNFYIHGWQNEAAFNFINGLDCNTLMKIDKHGKVGIGTTNTSDAKLTVAGKIIAEEMKIILSVPQSDFVFEEDYELMPLPELYKFVRTNKHLPGVPSAAEFAHEGYSVGEMDDLLLRKVEELTLYVIQLQNELAETKNKLESISQ
jgi:hypothetical protein